MSRRFACRLPPCLLPLECQRSGACANALVAAEAVDWWWSLTTPERQAIADRLGPNTTIGDAHHAMKGARP